MLRMWGGGGDCPCITHGEGRGCDTSSNLDVPVFILNLHMNERRQGKNTQPEPACSSATRTHKKIHILNLYYSLPTGSHF